MITPSLKARIAKLERFLSNGITWVGPDDPEAIPVIYLEDRPSYQVIFGICSIGTPFPFDSGKFTKMRGPEVDWSDIWLYGIEEDDTRTAAQMWRDMWEKMKENGAVYVPV